MKRNTLILLVGALALAALVYFLEIKPGRPRDEKGDTSKPAFNVTRDDIVAVTVTRGGQAVTAENRDGKWVITQPVNATADETAINSIVSGVANARIERTFSASEDDIKSYGLADPAVSIEVKLKNGEQHTVNLGGKDFSGLSVYGKVDNAREVSMLPSSLLTSADKSLDDLRDRSVLGASQFEINSLALTNEHGRIALDKDGADWKMKSPSDSPVDQSEISSLLSEFTSAKAEKVVAESDADLAKYGLDKPGVTLTARLQDGSERVVAVGSKNEDGYYAKTSDRPQIIKIGSGLYDKLNSKPSELLDKQIVKLKQDEITLLEIKNPNLSLVAEKKDNKWVVQTPADKKGKDLQTAKIFSALETKAKEVVDNPSASIKSRLASPPVVIQITDKSGKTTVVNLSSADGDDVYVNVKGRPEIYKVGKQVLEDLSFKAADVIN